MSIPELKLKATVPRISSAFRVTPAPAPKTSARLPQSVHASWLQAPGAISPTQYPTPHNGAQKITSPRIYPICYCEIPISHRIRHAHPFPHNCYRRSCPEQELCQAQRKSEPAGYCAWDLEEIFGYNTAADEAD